MKNKRNSIGRFIKELKRRNVFRVVALYAPGAFVLLEVMDIITPALALPPWVITLTIVVLAIGFPITVILAWIFDITPDGVRRTDDLDKEAAGEEYPPLVRRKLKVSDVIIAVLLIALGILIYPKIFTTDKLADVRDSEGKVTLAVLPFENLSGDTVFNVWSGGVQNLMISTLSNSEEISVRQYEAVIGALADNEHNNYASLGPVLSGEIADKLGTRTLVVGSILKAGDHIRLSAQLVDANTEEVYRTHMVEGKNEDDLFAMTDSLAGIIKNFVEIKKITEDENTPQYRGMTYRGSSEAFRYFIHGTNALMGEMDMQLAIQWFTRAIETDTTFITPYLSLSNAHLQAGNIRMSQRMVRAAYAKREQLSITDQLLVDQLYASFFETPEEEINYARQLIELDELNPMYHHLLAVAYYKTEAYEEAVPVWERSLEIHRKWGTEWKNPYVYFMLGDTYHKLGNHKRENEVLELGASIMPDNFMIVQYQTICALSHGEEGMANELLTHYQHIRKNVTYCPQAMILTGHGFIYEEANLMEEAEKYYRETTVVDPKNPNWKNTLSWFLIDNDIDIEEGLELNDQLLTRFPGHPSLLDTKGWGLYKKGEYKEALALIRQAWENKAVYNHSMYKHLKAAEKAMDEMN